MSEVNESGRCSLHPTMQLKSRKKNGEWRVLMDRCPLCASGLPADGESVSSRSSTGGNEPDGFRQSELNLNYNDDMSFNEQENRETNEHTGHDRAASRPRMRGERTPVKNRQATASIQRSPEHHQDHLVLTKTDDLQQKISLTAVNSYDSGATTEDDVSSAMSSSNVYEEFHNFLAEDQRKMAPASTSNGHMGSPGGSYSSPKPRPNSPLSFSPQGRGQQSPYQVMQHRLALPFYQNGSSRANLSPDPNMVKRPDPDESPGHNQGSFHHQQHIGRGAGTPKKTPQQQRHSKQQKQPHSPYNMDGYGTPKQQEPDEVSLNSASRYNTPRRVETDEISAASMNSAKRNLYKKSPHKPPQSPYTPNGESSYANEYSTPKPLEQDEVSAVSMSSVTRHLYTKSNESSEGDEASVSSGEDKEIATAECDAKGKCIRHPTVRLRKKKLFGGWQVVLSNCPECCLDEMRRVKDERSKSGKSKSGSSRCGSEAESRGGKSKASSKASRKKKDKRRERKKPPMSQVNIASGGEDDKSIGTASTITISSFTHASGGKHLKNWQDFTSNEEAGPARVTRMPYTDSNGERGWYTGAVDGTTGTPHGYGTMNYSTGAVFEGQWLHGKSVRQETQISSPAKARYPTQGHGVRRMHPPPPRSPLETHYEDDSRSSNSRSRSSSRPRARAQQQHSPMMQQQRKVVCGMPWADSTGSGAYTGEVNGLNIPDGVGSMRYNSGIVVEGLWRDGEIEEDANEDDKMSCQGGGGGQLDGFLGRNTVRARGNSGSASVM